jgi:hypothetical protein
MKMFVLRLASLIAAITTTLCIPPAGAIINGVADNGAHPNVGTVIWRDADGVLFRSCSGTLISSTVFLTAAHCVIPFPGDEDEMVVGVSFDEVTPPVPSYVRGTAYGDARFRWSNGGGGGATCCGSDMYDTGVVVFDEPITDITPAALPTLKLLDQLNAKNGLKGTKFVSVGYGATEPEQPGYAHCCGPPGTRKYGVETFRSLVGSILHLSQNAATGDSGGCYGDSGGPHFLGTSNVVVSVTMLGDMPCVSSDRSYRIDTPSARSFLANFVTLP